MIQKGCEKSKQTFQEFQDKFKKVCSTAPVAHVENDSSTTVKTNFGEYLKGSQVILPVISPCVACKRSI